MHVLSMHLSPPRFGWIDWTISVGDQTAVLRCSHVYDPFDALNELFESSIIDGLPGACVVNQEGDETIVRLDIEPGAATGRLRVYDSDGYGAIACLHLDAEVAVLACARAWVEAFSHMRALHDPEHWDAEDGVASQQADPLTRISLRALLPYTHAPAWVLLPHSFSPAD